MHPQATFYAIPLLLGSTIAVTLIFLAWQRVREPGARAFMVAMAGVALWSFAYAFEVMNSDLSGKLIWHKLIYVASAVVPAFWLLFLLQQTEPSEKLSQLWTGLLSIEPVLYTILTWTNDSHQFLWKQIGVEADNGLPHLVLARGLGFYIHTAFTYLLVLLSLVIFMRLLQRESSMLAPYQVLLCIAAILAPLLANAIHLLPFVPLQINLTPFALITMGAGVGWFAFRFELWDLVPVAHDAIIEHMNDGVIVLNLKHRVIDINPAAANLLGTSYSAAVGKPVEALFPDWLQSDALQQCLSDPRPMPASGFELVLTRPTKRYVDLAVAELRNRRKHVDGWLLTLHDVTHRREVEKALEKERVELAQRVAERTADLSEANLQLERASRLKDEFLANMSHELRTPLNTILGLSEALFEQVYGPLTPKQLRSLQNIDESGRHLLALINDVLDISKIEAGKLQLQLSAIAVDSLCQASLNFVKQSALNKNLALELYLAPNVKVVYGDERRLKQILVNLLNNAVKFTPEGGKIGLETRGYPGEEQIEFAVWDTGVGIAQEDMARLFEPFVQLDSRLARQYEGTGLGLTMVYRMTKMHGGSVRVESEVGVGSKFTISLPWNSTQSVTTTQLHKLHNGQPKAQAPQKQSETRAATTNLAGGAALESRLEAVPPRVFVVEDNETTITTFTDYLLAQGYAVDVVRNGAEALNRLREARPDLILLDIQMPDMDGLEVMRQVRNEQRLQSVPIVALTALAVPGDRDRCLAAGATEYMSKPISLTRLANLIEIYANDTTSLTAN
ncbi:MAG: histidine kinase N-terminal 7TM domain-containing protein [Caldilineaceae bacterium]